uniref:ShKT domain-containing protein n=1 Tax=Syphacia muris TaxID=451379 RepID=A0A0N5AV21_9BILA
MFWLKNSTVAVLCAVVAVAFAALESCSGGISANPCIKLFADKAKCSDSSLKSFAENCPVTCGTCANANADCKDTGEMNCMASLASGLCENKLYKSVMEVHCGKTCNLCSTRTGKYVKGENKDMCKDIDEKYCQENKELCNKVNIYDKMTKKCPSTCQRCPLH